jgi:subfamily B ATP-binding cassette protein MsbA
MRRVSRFDPGTFGLILFTGLATAMLEGIGLSFIVPVIELARAGPGSANSGRFVEVFARAFEILGLSFTIENVIIGVTVVIAIRYTASFLSAYLSKLLMERYIRHLRTRTFEGAMAARISYFDRKGSNDILNAIITETKFAGESISNLSQLFRVSAITLIYVGIALYISPLMTFLSVLFLGGITFIVRYVIEPGERLGSILAESNNRLQEYIQTGTQGIREVKLFGLEADILRNFYDAMDEYVTVQVKLVRNKLFISNFYNFIAAAVIFGLIYVAIRFTPLSVGELAVFLFAMYRLAPRASNLNNVYYSLEGNIPHLVRSHAFIDELADARRSDDGERPVDRPITEVRFEEITFGYDEGTVLEGIDFAAHRGELVALVGPSGVGKSTVVLLLARMYEPTDGTILADEIPIDEYDLDDWRGAVAYVQQHPYIFDDTLRENVMLGDPTATREEFDRICELARINEFRDELANGYDTPLGDDGVRLSGGQRQRVALARALLKDADILILDEATSELDAQLEEEIYEAIDTLRGNRITFVIAHRLSTVRSADTIYALQDGEIVEQGKHEELLDREGAYSEMYTRAEN